VSLEKINRILYLCLVIHSNTLAVFLLLLDVVFLLCRKTVAYFLCLIFLPVMFIKPNDHCQIIFSAICRRAERLRNNIEYVILFTVNSLSRCNTNAIKGKIATLFWQGLFL
jgi:hypothetical protein